MKVSERVAKVSVELEGEARDNAIADYLRWVEGSDALERSRAETRVPLRIAEIGNWERRGLGWRRALSPVWRNNW